jgi:hypothetical protein
LRPVRVTRIAAPIYPPQKYPVTIIENTHVDLQGTTYAFGSIAAGCSIGAQAYPVPWAMQARI